MNKITLPRFFVLVLAFSSGLVSAVPQIQQTQTGTTSTTQGTVDTSPSSYAYLGKTTETTTQPAEVPATHPTGPNTTATAGIGIRF